MITIDTRRFSAVVAAFVAAYPTARAYLDRRALEGPMENWCTNATLKAAIDFSLRLEHTELLGFHDGPSNMWAADEALPLVDSLAKQRLLRFSVSRSKPGFFARLFGRLTGWGDR